MRTHIQALTRPIVHEMMTARYAVSKLNGRAVVWHKVDGQNVTFRFDDEDGARQFIAHQLRRLPVRIHRTLTSDGCLRNAYDWHVAPAGWAKAG